MCSGYDPQPPHTSFPFSGTLTKIRIHTHTLGFGTKLQKRKVIHQNVKTVPLFISEPPLHDGVRVRRRLRPGPPDLHREPDPWRDALLRPRRHPDLRLHGQEEAKSLRDIQSPEAGVQCSETRAAPDEDEATAGGEAHLKRSEF